MPGRNARRMRHDQNEESVVDGRCAVRITEVEAGSLASFAGLQPRQVITSVNGRPVADVEQFEKELARKDLKEGMRLHVQSSQGSRFVYLKDSGRS